VHDSQDSAPAPRLYPVFLRLVGRPVVLVGGGAVAAAKYPGLVESGAAVTVVAPVIGPALRDGRARLVERAFVPDDLDGAWFVVSAAPPAINRQVVAAAEALRVFVNAVDDPEVATVYLGGVVRRGPATVAISTGGGAPALASLLREALEAIVPDDLERWVTEARKLRAGWRAAGVPLAERRPLLLDALNRLYGDRAPPAPPPSTPPPGDPAP
jgi:uroporphyrin-III C-methyltransferase/precorrin-2 dehydrogenase/sirohydrochlorin ferrochelatase